jgi:hypothetical protein
MDKVIGPKPKKIDETKSACDAFFSPSEEGPTEELNMNLMKLIAIINERGPSY